MGSCQLDLELLHFYQTKLANFFYLLLQHNLLKESLVLELWFYEVVANGSHFSLKVISPVFEGKKTLEKQRMVYGALKDLMAGSNAPVHAIDHLETLVPEN